MPSCGVRASHIAQAAICSLTEFSSVSEPSDSHWLTSMPSWAVQTIFKVADGDGAGAPWPFIFVLWKLLAAPSVLVLYLAVRVVTRRYWARPMPLRLFRALNEGQGLYRLLFNSHPQPMWVYDLETLNFLAVNDAAVAHYGYTRDEFLRMSIMDIGPRDFSNANWHGGTSTTGQLQRPSPP